MHSPLAMLSLSHDALLCYFRAFWCSSAAPAADLVTQVPGFNVTSFVYSGYLPCLALPEDGFPRCAIHPLSVAHVAERPIKRPACDLAPGWPGGSSINVGLYTEMGYFQLSDQGSYVNENA